VYTESSVRLCYIGAKLIFESPQDCHQPTILW